MYEFRFYIYYFQIKCHHFPLPFLFSEELHSLYISPNKVRAKIVMGRVISQNGRSRNVFKNVEGHINE